MSKSERGHVMMEAEVGVMLLLALKVEKGPRAKECGQPLEAGKGKETDSLLELPEGT